MLASWLGAGASRALARPPVVAGDPVPNDYRDGEIYAGYQYASDPDDGRSCDEPSAALTDGAMPNVLVSFSTLRDFGIKHVSSKKQTVGCRSRFRWPDQHGDTIAVGIGLVRQIGAYHAIVFSVGRELNANNTAMAYASYEFALGPVAG